MIQIEPAKSQKKTGPPFTTITLDVIPPYFIFKLNVSFCLFNNTEEQSRLCSLIYDILTSNIFQYSMLSKSNLNRFKAVKKRQDRGDKIE